MITPRSSAASGMVAAGSLLVGLIATGCGVQTGNNTKLDPLFAQWNQPGSPGAAVVIVRDGAVVYQRGYGYANLGQRIPITPQTRFDTASVAKQFTGLAVAMLGQQGKLSPDDEVRQYLPDVPDFGKRITLGHLIHHTSGLRDWPETLGLSGCDMEAPITLDMILEMVRRQRELDFAPGEEYLYSNTGYNLLAAVVAKVTGQSFRAWTDTNLFQPLGMKHTLVCDDPSEIVPDIASCYVPDNAGKFRRVDSQYAAQGSSSMWITAEDLGKWLINLETARVGGKAAVEMMAQPGKLNGGDKVSYGYGVEMGEYQGAKTIHHGGGAAGWRSFTLVIPEKRFAVGILANAGNLDAPGMAFKIADIYLGAPAEVATPPPATSPSAVKADPVTWDSFSGTYRLGPGWLLTIMREGDQLMAQATGENKFKMTPTGTNTFFVEAYGQAVEFVRNSSGSVTNLRYRGIHAPKLVLPEFTPERLAGYVGDYWSEELRVVGRLEIHDGQLASHQRSGEWLHFVPTGPDRFDGVGVNLVLEFTRNAASEVTEAKASGGRVRHIRYARVTLPKAKPEK